MASQSVSYESDTVPDTIPPTPSNSAIASNQIIPETQADNIPESQPILSSFSTLSAISPINSISSSYIQTQSSANSH